MSGFVIATVTRPSQGRRTARRRSSGRHRKLVTVESIMVALAVMAINSIRPYKATGVHMSSFYDFGYTQAVYLRRSGYVLPIPFWIQPRIRVLITGAAG